MFKKISYLVAALLVIGTAGSINAKGTCWRFLNTSERDNALSTSNFEKIRGCSQQATKEACQQYLKQPKNKALGTVGIWAPTCAECSAGKCESMLMEKID